MSKKILSVMLALVMVLSVFSVSAFAAVSSRYEKIDEDAGETQIAHTQKWSLVAPEAANEDGTYTVDVVLETNYYTGIISFDIIAEGAELVKADKGSAITYDADVAYFEGMTHVDIIPNPTLAQAAGLAPKFAAGSVVAKVTYRLTGSSATLKLMNDSKCAGNPGGSLFAVRLENETLASNTVYYGQRVIDADGKDIAVGAEIASVTLGSAAEPADLVLTAAGAAAGIIIDTNKFASLNLAGVVYGVAAATSARSTPADYAGLWEATNGGTITYQKSPYAGRSTRYGTGTVITVSSEDGSSKDYVLVIFGDMNGDGVLNNNDVGTIYSGQQNNTIADEKLRLAANVKDPGRASGQTAANTLYNITGEDTGLSYSETQTANTIKQATLATHHNKYNYYYQ